MRWPGRARRRKPATSSGRRCGGCAAAVGEPHDDGCDVARCLRSGQQRLQCPAADSEFHDCGREIWTGVWPGEAECREWGWLTYFEPPAEGEQYGRWIDCGPDHPKAGPDLNRLHVDAHWDPGTGRWQKGRCDHENYTDHVVVGEDGPDVLRVCGRCGHISSSAFLAAIGHPLPNLLADADTNTDD